MRIAVPIKTLFVLFCAAALSMFAVPSVAVDLRSTKRVYLSGTDKDNRVAWDFYCTEGARSGEWTTIPVPSCWDVEGFGTLAFGRVMERGYETGKYRHRFTTPAAAQGNRAELVLEGVMTDAEVRLNGHSAGPVHQGSFYRFSYDVTDLLHAAGQENLLEVDVAKESANQGVNDAERWHRADYWIFGGIFRPVYLEIYPPVHIEGVAIDARHDGTFRAEVQMRGGLGRETLAIAAWPTGETSPGLMATLVDVSGALYPATYDGRPVRPMEGVSLRPALHGDRLAREQPIFFEHEGNRAVRDGKWKLVAKGPGGAWELYNMENDRTELHDLAARQPARVQRLAAAWEDWALRADVLPWPWKPAYTPMFRSETR